MKTHFWGIFALIFLVSCNHENKVEKVERAFYYWHSNGGFSEESEKGMENTKVRKLYVKYFEVDYNEAQGNHPVDKVYGLPYSLKENDSLKVIPTIFIKNDIFQYNNNQKLDSLASNIVFLIDKYNNEKFKEIKYFEEYQIDCDWTKSSKEKYFYLLKKIKEKSEKKISCTLRLYPYKYPEIMGVPPTDKVMLMCYNLIKPLTNKNKNSILDVNELKKYLDKTKSYPLPMDVALPIFSWSHIYQNNQFNGLVNLNSKEIAAFTKKTKPFWYEVTKDTIIDYSTYLRKGDQIKCEEINTQQLNEAIKVITSNTKLNKSITVSLFNINEKTFNNFTHEEISGFYNTFTK